MQAVELILIAAGGILGLAWLVTRHHDTVRTDRTWMRAMLGVVPGLIGALLIIVARSDLLPDELEGSAWTIALVAVSGFFIIATTYRLARR